MKDKIKRSVCVDKWILDSIEGGTSGNGPGIKKGPALAG